MSRRIFTAPAARRDHAASLHRYKVTVSGMSRSSGRDVKFSFEVEADSERSAIFKGLERAGDYLRTPVLSHCEPVSDPTHTTPEA
jgi:hypothetical protein